MEKMVEAVPKPCIWRFVRREWRRMATSLTYEQLDWRVEHVPDPSVSPKCAQPAMDKRHALRGIFWVLDNRAK
jgi:hypothetical protein